MERRDYSAPADAPYTAEDVVVHTPARDSSLPGTLTIPRGRADGPRAGGGDDHRIRAARIATRSRRRSRDYRPFRELADTLGRRGIAVLRLDDRGVNGSDRGPPTRDVARLRRRHSRGRGVSAHASGDRRRPDRARRPQRGRDHRADDCGDRSATAGDRADGGDGVARAETFCERRRCIAIDSMSHLTGAARARAIAKRLSARGFARRPRVAVDEVLPRVRSVGGRRGR